MSMIRIIPISNVFLALSAIYLKVLYGNIEFVIIRLLKEKNMSNEIMQDIVFSNNQLSFSIIIISAISIIIASVSLYKKLCNRILCIIFFSISFISFFFSLIPI